MSKISKSRRPERPIDEEGEVLEIVYDAAVPTSRPFLLSVCDGYDEDAVEHKWCCIYVNIADLEALLAYAREHSPADVRDQR